MKYIGLNLNWIKVLWNWAHGRMHYRLAQLIDTWNNDCVSSKEGELFLEVFDFVCIELCQVTTTMSYCTVNSC